MAVHNSQLIREGIGELNQIRLIVEGGGYGEDQIQTNFSVVRGLEYYTGPVFEVELTFPVEGDDGKPVRFGSVAGGGRYDGLVGRFRNENIPATGISIGVSRLMVMFGDFGSDEQIELFAREVLPALAAKT